MPTHPLLQRYRGCFPEAEWPGRGVATLPLLGLMLRMSRAVPLLSLCAFMASYGANFTFTFTLTDLHTNRPGPQPRRNKFVTCFNHIPVSEDCRIRANNCPTRCNYIQFIYIYKPLYMFRVVSPPVVRSSCHGIHSI